MPKRAFAIAAHPDDIEFMMSGTMILLGRAGYELHYMTLANGSCGSARLGRNAIVKIRRREAIAAAKSISAVFHESLVNDIEIFYEKKLLARLGAIVREVSPEILLTHGPDEYMEDHSGTCRLAVTAAFCRGMRNFPVTPGCDPVSTDVAVYHALPLGLRSPLGKPVTADIYVDVADVLDRKRCTLALHKSQKEWLDKSQGMDSYLVSMEDTARRVGEMSGRFTHAEGWIRRFHQGFCAPDFNPLIAALGPERVAAKP